MTQNRNRKLAAILFADIVGYTAMMQADESRARQCLETFHAALKKQVEVNRGEVINDLGDGCLVIFDSAVDATNCALALQQEYISEPVVPVRIGLHSGDVFFEHNNVYGDAVNLASRIESLGVPGSVLFSDTIRAQIHNKPEFAFKSLGQFDFKNVQGKMEVFALKNIGLPIPKRTEMMGKLKAKKSKAVPALLIGVLLSLFTIGFLVSPWGPYGQQAYAKTLAVLPFDTQGPDQSEFAQNVSAEVLEALRKSKGVDIPATALSPNADFTGQDTETIGKTLDVAHVLKGDVRKIGNRTEVIVRLMSTKDGQELWSETFITDGEDTSAIGKQIAANVTQTVPEQIKAAAKAEEKSTAIKTNEPDRSIAKAKSEDGDVSIEHKSTILLGKQLSVSWEGRENSADYIDIVKAGHEDANGALSVNTISKGNPVKLFLPEKPGNYEVRYIEMGDNYKKIIKVTSPLIIEDVETTIEYAPTIALGKRLSVNWAGPGGPADYIDIVKVGHDEIGGALSGNSTDKGNPVKLYLPEKPGDYEVRYIHQGANYKKIIKTRSPLKIEDVETSIEHDPIIALGKRLSVSWIGPDGPGDYVDIVKAGHDEIRGALSNITTDKGNPARLYLPEKPGEYEVRYVHQGANYKKTIKARSPLTIEDVETSVEHDPTIALGKRLSVTWTGPDGPGDYVDIVKAGHDEIGGALSNITTDKGNPVRLYLPEKPGNYEVRYIHQGANYKKTIKAQSPLTIEDVETRVEHDPTIEIGKQLSVTWVGPDGPGDYIDIVEAGHDEVRGLITSTVTDKGNPVKLRLPENPGDYEVRYIHQGANYKKTIKARSPLTIVEAETP